MTPRPEELPNHLRYQQTTRGSLIMPEIVTHAFGGLHLSESSAGDGAYAWLRVSAANTLDQPLTNRTEVVLHVGLDELEDLRDQIEFLIDHHRNTVRKGVDVG